MSVNRRSTLSLVVFSSGLLAGAWLPAADFRSLRKEYDDAKAKAGGLPKDRAEKVQKNVAPVLQKIGELDSKESLAFLLGEIKSAPPEIAAACAGPILASTNESAVKLVLQDFAAKPPVVKVGILDALTKTSKDLKPVEAEIVALAQASTEPEPKKAFAPLLGKIDTPAAAKVLLLHVQAGKAPKGEDPQLIYNVRAEEALAKTKNEEVKKWLAKGAFAGAGSDAARLSLLAHVAGDLKLEDARGELAKAINHGSSEVAAAAINALTKIGLGDEADEVASALEKRKGKADTPFRIQALDALAVSGSERAVELILKFAKSGDPETRAVAMGSLGLAKQSPKALEALCKGLEDEDSSVRATAVRALGRHRDKAMVKPLIDYLGTEKEERLKVNALEILVDLTGQNMGLVHEDWKKWWTIAEEKFVLADAKAGEKGSTNVKARSLSYFGIEVSSKRAAFLVDCSSSMTIPMTVTPRTAKDDEEEKAREKEGKTSVEKGGGQRPGGGGGGGGGAGATKAKRIDVLKREMVRVIKALPADMQINIITFNRTFTPWQKELQPLAGPGRQKAVQFVEGLTTGTGTNVFDTLEAALKDKRVDTIYLLTDGEPTQGRITQGDAIITEIKAQNRTRGATIHCIGFGEDSPFLKKLAEENGGKYRFVDKY